MGSALTTAKAGTFGTVPVGLAERLQWLCRFGKPRVSMLSGGWHATIDMNTNTTGTSFEVQSEFRMKDPETAVEQLTERMLAALETVHRSQESDDGRG